MGVWATGIEKRRNNESFVHVTVFAKEDRLYRKKGLHYYNSNHHCILEVTTVIGTKHPTDRLIQPI